MGWIWMSKKVRQPFVVKKPNWMKYFGRIRNKDGGDGKRKADVLTEKQQQLQFNQKKIFKTLSKWRW